MKYILFEGRKDVRSVRTKDDVEFFEYAKKRLNFPRDLDLVIFCAALGIYKCAQLKETTKEENPKLKKLIGITSFDSAKLFDLIVMHYLSTDTERIQEFEKYFYTGFIYLKKWFETNEKDMSSPLERFINLAK